MGSGEGAEEVGARASSPRGQGRLRRQPGGRGQVIYLRCTEAEYLAVARKAAEAGVSPQRFLLETALDPRRIGVAERRGLVASFLAARRTLAGLATNVNQLAKVANATGEVSPTTPFLLARIEAAEAALTEAVEAVTPSYGAPR